MVLGFGQRRRNIISQTGSSTIKNSGNRSILPTTASGSGNGTNQLFNPRLIFSQIIALQCLHYFTLSILFQINYSIWGSSINIDRIFTDTYVNIWTKEGRIDAAAILLGCVIGAVLLAVIVGKSKKVLDFSVTLFFIHFLTCSIYCHKFISSWDWWIIHVLGMIIMILLGEYLCSRVELREIPLL